MFNRSICLATIFALFFVAASPCKGVAQTLTPKTIDIDSNCHGFYEYLPSGYDAQKKYPLIIFLHGLGELGNGDTELRKVLRNGLPRLLADSTFPVSFTVKGETFQFIVFAPQFLHWPWPATTQTVIDYAIEHYAVDKSRIYLTGLSMGGGALWECVGNNAAYANKLAAVVPVCGASLTDSTKAARIAAANLPVWATHNQGDPTVTVTFTEKYISYINAAPTPPTEPAKKTIFPVNGHNAWTKTYDPLFKEDGVNIYEWMLLHHR